MFEKKIIFSSTEPELLEPPVPAKKQIPDWFKKMKNYIDPVKNYRSPTVKKCMPFLDSLTSGYVIKNTVEVVFWWDKDDLLWDFPRIDLNTLKRLNMGIETHDAYQISKSSFREYEIPVPFKYINPWNIQTPKNYSCLFTNLLNRENDSIRILDGIVETDNYDSQVNFPFFLKSFPKDKTFILKKGSPIALVFPFKRDDWKMTINKLSDKDLIKREKNRWNMFTILEDNYKNFLWRRKKYD